MSDLEKTEKTESENVFHIGGSIEKSEKGEYNLNVKTILAEGWQTTKTARLVVNISFLYCIFIGMLISFVLVPYLGGVTAVLDDPKSSWLLNIVATIILSPFLGGVEMIGIYNSVKLKTHNRLIFSFLNRGSLVAICALITSSISSIGLTLFIIPGIYLMVALSLTSPLVIEKRLSPVQAIIVSIKATRFQWFKIFALYAFIGGCFAVLTMMTILLSQGPFPIVGSVLFIYGFSYVMPLFYNVKGIIYREIFGLTVHSVNGENIQTTFSA